MSVRCDVSYLAALIGTCSLAMATDPTIVTGLTYVCNRERLDIESCNIRDLSDNSTCMVAMSRNFHV